MTNRFGGDIVIERTDVENLLASYKPASADPEEGQHAHRHDRHSFFLLERGSVTIEIDFQKYKMKAPSVIYMHPDQVHRTSDYKKVIVSSWAINNENLNPEYLPLLEDIRPAKPLLLQKETFSIISDAVSLSLKFSERKNEKLYVSLLRNGGNTLVALVLSEYLALAKPTDKFSRFELITKAFREQLERNYTSAKRPGMYAKKLNISISYLNECVKNTTGHSVSHHIQQRVILEAKRLLYHSGQSVKKSPLHWVMTTTLIFPGCLPKLPE